MGSAKKIRRKYSRPSHPWQKYRLDAEAIIRKEYGTGSKNEIWKMNSKLKSILKTTKRVYSSKTVQAQKEKDLLLARLKKYGWIAEGQGLDQILSLKLEDIMNRRLQTLVFKKEMALTPKQARQMIVHRHIKVGDCIITSPSYLVPIDEELLIKYVEKSTFNDPAHPERAKKTKEGFESTEEKAKKKGKKEEGRKKEESLTTEAK